MNHGIWRVVTRLETTFFDFVWRLLVGRYVYGPRWAEHEWSMHRAVAESVTHLDAARAIAYPSENAWIVEQIALWLTLGWLPGLSQAQLSTAQALQDGEYREPGRLTAETVVVHYFSTLQADFRAWLSHDASSCN